MSALRDGLRDDGNAVPTDRGDSRDIIGAFFDSTPQPRIRRARTCDLFQVYRDADAIAHLGEALTRHLGSLHGAAADLPCPDNLQTWAAAWDEAGKDGAAFRLPLRLLRTGIDFLKAGGTDPGILPDLNQEEHRLLEQVFELEPSADAWIAR
ncbi:hypothetical protein [Thiocystis violacea]|uniref:hypothetical protein n=1 Tax=Thiocystis violacea TaxID=13725 RepID=UPI001F5B1F4B|nr:hypothetical protein [Thiocystis violacea]